MLRILSRMHQHPYSLSPKYASLEGFCHIENEVPYTTKKSHPSFIAGTGHIYYSCGATLLDALRIHLRYANTYPLLNGGSTPAPLLPFPQSPLPHNGSGFSLLSKAHSIQQSVLHFHLLQLSVTSFLYVLMLYQRFIKFYAIFVKMSIPFFIFSYG